MNRQELKAWAIFLLTDVVIITLTLIFLLGVWFLDKLVGFLIWLADLSLWPVIRACDAALGFLFEPVFVLGIRLNNLWVRFSAWAKRSHLAWLVFWLSAWLLAVWLVFKAGGIPRS